MGLTFQMTVANAEQLDFALVGLRGDVARAMEIAGPAVMKTLEALEAEQFAMRGASGAHGPWAPLTQSYLVRKFKKWGAQPIEVASGAVRSSLTEPDAPGAVRTISALALEFGTSLPYAMYQQMGFRTRRGTAKGLKRRAALPLEKGRLDRRRGGLALEGEKREFVAARRLIDPNEDWAAEIQTAIMVALDNKARARGFGTAPTLLGRKLGRGEAPLARQIGYGVLTGSFMGEGIS